VKGVPDDRDGGLLTTEPGAPSPSLTADR